MEHDSNYYVILLKVFKKYIIRLLQIHCILQSVARNGDILKSSDQGYAFCSADATLLIQARLNIETRR